MSDDKIVKGLCQLCREKRDHFLHIDWWEDGKNYKKQYCCHCYSIIKLAECLAIERASSEYFAELKKKATMLLDSGIMDFEVTIIDKR